MLKEYSHTSDNRLLPNQHRIIRTTRRSSNRIKPQWCPGRKDRESVGRQLRRLRNQAEMPQWSPAVEAGVSYDEYGNAYDITYAAMESGRGGRSQIRRELAEEYVRL